MITKPWSNHYNKPILHFPQQLIDPHPLSLSLSIPFSFFIFIVHFWLPLKALRENRTKKWETEWKDLFFFHSRLGVSLNQALMLLFNDNNSSNNLEDQSHHQLIITKALLEQVLVNSFISNFHKSTSACCMHWWGLFNFFYFFILCVCEGNREEDEESLSSNESMKSSFRLSKPDISTGFHRLFKSFKSFSQLFGKLNLRLKLRYNKFSFIFLYDI